MKLAKNGGESVNFGNIPQWPIWDDDTVNALKEVLKSNYWAISGIWCETESACQKFEVNYAKYNNIKYCATFDHGSSSLVAALQALNIGPGDEVILPALTWVACIISVLNVNAIPIVVDVDPETYCISVDEIKKAITKNTKAIMPVHLYGCMADMDEIKKIAEKYDIYVVEDASHSHGSIWKGQRAGSIGNIGCFSFQQGKIITSGEGGAAITNDFNLYNRLIELRTNSRCYIKPNSRKRYYVPLQESGRILGTNFCLSEFQAAILNSQLVHLEDWNEHKEKNAIYLDNELNKLPGISTMFRHPQIDKQSYYRYCIKIDNNHFKNKSIKAIANALECELGFPIEQPYPPLNKSLLYNPYTLKSLHWSSEYLNYLDLTKITYPVAENASYNQGIIFHHSILLANKTQMDKIIEAFYKISNYSDEI